MLFGFVPKTLCFGSQTFFQSVDLLETASSLDHSAHLDISAVRSILLLVKNQFLNIG